MSIQYHIVDISNGLFALFINKIYIDEFKSKFIKIGGKYNPSLFHENIQGGWVFKTILKNDIINILNRDKSILNVVNNVSSILDNGDMDEVSRLEIIEKVKYGEVLFPVNKK